MTLLMIDNKMCEEGREIEVFLSVQEGDYGVKRGAEKLGISEEEFISRMEKVGYRVPEVVEIKSC